MPQKPCHLDPRRGERGGITIVIALVLIVLMSLAAFSLSRNSIRQMAASGNLLQGGKASVAADAGLDWFVVWSGADNSNAAYLSGSSSANKSLATALYDMTHYYDLSGSQPDWYTHLSSDNLLASTDPNRVWDMAALIKSDESDASSSDMVFDNTSAKALQSKNNTGNPVVQRFDLFVRYLGTSSVAAGTSTSVVGSAAGGANVNTSAIADRYYQVISTGYAAVPMGNGNYLRYIQRREAIVSAPPF